MVSYPIAVRAIERKIFFVRNHKVMLDTHLAELYGVSTKRLNEQVHRNLKRFPPDFMFQVTQNEAEILRSQIATSSWGGRRTPPFVFTEHGALMAANVLHSDRAIRMSVFVLRAFVRLRNMLSTHKDLQLKIRVLEKRFNKKFAVVFDALRELFDGPKRKFRVKGFHSRP